MEFRDQVVLVVGASSGIGRAVAVRLARQGAVLVGRHGRHGRTLGLAERSFKIVPDGV